MGTLSRICLVMKDLFTSWLTITKWLPPAFWGFRPFFVNLWDRPIKWRNLPAPYCLLPVFCHRAPTSNHWKGKTFWTAFLPFPFTWFCCWWSIVEIFSTIVPIHNVTHQETRLCKSGLGIFVQRRHQYMLAFLRLSCVRIWESCVTWFQPGKIRWPAWAVNKHCRLDFIVLAA